MNMNKDQIRLTTLAGIGMTSMIALFINPGIAIIGLFVMIAFFFYYMIDMLGD